MKKTIKTALFFLVLCAAVYYIGYPWYQINRADKLMYQGEYSKAEELVMPYIDHFVWGKTARAQQRDLYGLEATKSMQAKEYSAAAVAYQKLSDDENAYKAWMALGDASMSESDYEHAVEGYSNAGETSLMKAAYEKWGDQMLSSNRFDEAKKYYRLAERTYKVNKAVTTEAEYLISIDKPYKVRDVIQGFTGGEIGEVLFKAFRREAQWVQENHKDNKQQIHEEIVNLANQYGTSTKDIDTQLAYCKLLTENGYSLKEIYPNGVDVVYSLSNYQIYKKTEYGRSLPTFWDYTNSSSKKIICFSRIEEQPTISTDGIEYGQKTLFSTDEEENPIHYVDSHRWSSTDYYTVKLLPALMEDLSPSLRANSLGECGKYLIIDMGYIPSGYISVVTTTTSFSTDRYSTPLTTSTTNKAYIFYSAYESITLYNRSDPNDFVVYDVNEHSSKLANCSITDENTGGLLQTAASLGRSITVPDKDETGKDISYKGKIDPISGWYNDYYALGTHDTEWLTDKRISKAISSINRGN